MKHIFLIVLCITIRANTTLAQSISPATINVGGGSFSNNFLELEWSVGEATVVESFQIGSNYIITNGVLQPYTTTAVAASNTTPQWAMADLRIYPVPTQSIVNINFLSSLKGRMRLDLLDDRMRLLATQEFDYYGTNGNRQWDLAKYASGNYFIRITLVANDQSIIKQGSFKVQKIN